MKRILILIALVIVMVALHETTHYVIFSYYNCKDIKAGFCGINPCVDADLASCSYLSDMKMLHGLNDIVGYNIMPFLTMILYFVILKHNQ